MGATVMPLADEGMQGLRTTMLAAACCFMPSAGCHVPAAAPGGFDLNGRARIRICLSRLPDRRAVWRRAGLEHFAR